MTTRTTDASQAKRRSASDGDIPHDQARPCHLQRAPQHRASRSRVASRPRWRPMSKVEPVTTDLAECIDTTLSRCLGRHPACVPLASITAESAVSSDSPCLRVKIAIDPNDPAEGDRCVQTPALEKLSCDRFVTTRSRQWPSARCRSCGAGYAPASTRAGSARANASGSDRCAGCQEPCRPQRDGPLPRGLAHAGHRRRRPRARHLICRSCSRNAMRLASHPTDER